MLSRSSLETQKLELMSAMSELKLQQAALERENLDLRTNHLNNNLVNGNAGHNGSTGSIIRRPPMAPTRLTSTTSSASAASTPSPSIAAQTNGHPLGGSHGNLQQQGLPANGSSAPMVCGGMLLLLFVNQGLTFEGLFNLADPSHDVSSTGGPSAVQQSATAILPHSGPVHK